jgi:iron complex transport system substrate-binding protein
MGCHRIVSLLPAATEIAWGLGLGDCLVGRSHECDWPTACSALQALTSPHIDPFASSCEIHETVGLAIKGAATSAGLFRLDIDGFAALKPDLVLTQATCKVCAIPTDDVAQAVTRAGYPARIVSVSATTIAGLWRDIFTVGAATDTLPRARDLVARLQARCDSVACRAGTLGRVTLARPKVAVIEWLDPPMAAGNWVPELIRLAGGVDVLGHAGAHSHWIDWPTVAKADPDVVILAPCGFTLERILAEVASPTIRPHVEMLRAFREGRAWAMDGHHLLNRPGPRLVDSLEVIAELLAPEAFRFPTTGRFARRLSMG